MKIGIVGDIHWSKYSSIIRTRGNRYSTRLENCLESVNWAEQQLKDCDLVVYLGDFFDCDSLHAEELTALSQIKWNKVPHKFLVGNHELGLNNLMFSSAHVFDMANIYVVDMPTTVAYSDDFELCYLPYMLNSTESSITDYFGTTTGKRIIFSHNDIKGIQLGKFVSTNGFDIKDIEDNCDLFINGHLHNATKVSDKIHNIGNLTGQNFSEDAFKYTHNIAVLDTDTMELENIKNPNAFNFFKITEEQNIKDIIFPPHSVITAKVYSCDLEETTNFVNDNENIIAHRFIVVEKERKGTNTTNNVTLTVNHLDEFRNFVMDKLGNSETVISELTEVVR